MRRITALLSFVLAVILVVPELREVKSGHRAACILA